MRCFSKQGSHFTISELARQLHLDRSTTYRILLSLEKSGFVEKDEKTGEYSLGMAAFEIGNAFLRQMDFVKISKPIMADLALKVQETVHLAVFSDSEIVYVDKADSPRTLGVMSKIGQRAPVYCSALRESFISSSIQRRNGSDHPGDKTKALYQEHHHLQKGIDGGVKRDTGERVCAGPDGI